jgi:hypothetical protein
MREPRFVTAINCIDGQAAGTLGSSIRDWVSHPQPNREYGVHIARATALSIPRTG